jgi:DUF971 family protein
MPGDPSDGANRTQAGSGDGPAAGPKDIKVVLAEQRLRIVWKDGRQSDYALDSLRRQCPCATCRTERQNAGNNPLKILKFNPSGLRVVSAQLVGHYAIRFTWSDGHDTGIFDFRLLRALDEAQAGS